jgi:AcrR family transcriptional regulator
MDVIPDVPVDTVLLNGHAQDVIEDDRADFSQDFSKFHGMTSVPSDWPVDLEKTWHKAAAVLFAKGATTINEVAETVGVNRATVRNLLKQPWFQKRVTDLMLEYGAKDIMALFKAESMNSLITLVELRDNEKAPSAVRRASAVDILDRALGKPLQRTETSEAPKSSDPVAEVARLEAQNAHLRGKFSTDAASVAARAEDEQ